MGIILAMVIWIASYPRSGNSLFGQVLKCCLGLNRFSTLYVSKDRPRTNRFRSSVTSNDPKRMRDLGIGFCWRDLYPTAQSFKEIYPAVSQREGTYLVKTHDHPLDDQPAIHIVRDARLVFDSYLRFLRAHHPARKATLGDVILGNDAFGCWSEHTKAWQAHKGKRLEIRYEDLVQSPPGLIRRIADFIGHTGEINPWVNPIEKSRQHRPELVCSGSSQWKGSPGWGPFEDVIFAHVHGKTMRQLGYWSSEDEATALASLSEPFHESLTKLIESFTELAKLRTEPLRRSRVSGIANEG